MYNQFVARLITEKLFNLNSCHTPQTGIAEVHMSKDSKIIEQIKSEKRDFILRTNKEPDLVFVHPSLLSGQYDSIDGMEVVLTNLIKENNVIISVRSDLVSNPFGKKDREVLPIWHRNFPDHALIWNSMR
ncbi:hypothetical protein ACVBWA_000240 [Acinetobacter baumannii]